MKYFYSLAKHRSLFLNNKKSAKKVLPKRPGVQRNLLVIDNNRRTTTQKKKKLKLIQKSSKWHLKILFYQNLKMPNGRVQYFFYCVFDFVVTITIRICL